MNVIAFPRPVAPIAPPVEEPASPRRRAKSEDGSRARTHARKDRAGVSAGLLGTFRDDAQTLALSRQSATLRLFAVGESASACVGALCAGGGCNAWRGPRRWRCRGAVPLVIVRLAAERAPTLS